MGDNRDRQTSGSHTDRDRDQSNRQGGMQGGGSTQNDMHRSGQQDRQNDMNRGQGGGTGNTEPGVGRSQQSGQQHSAQQHGSQQHGGQQQGNQQQGGQQHGQQQGNQQNREWDKDKK